MIDERDGIKGFTPKPGLVINYWYSWKVREDGTPEPPLKPRPCVILSVTASKDGQRLRLAPITHRQPDAPRDGIAISKATKTRMGLDDRPQWVITTNNNVTTDKSPDIVPIWNSNPSTCLYGVMPVKLGQVVKRDVKRHHEIGRLVQILRDRSGNREKDQGIER